MKNAIKTGTAILCAMILLIGPAETKHIGVAAEPVATATPAKPGEAENSITIKGVNYHANDYNKFAAFLKQPSDIKGITNAQALEFDVNNPAKWKIKGGLGWEGVIWNNDNPKRIKEIFFWDEIFLDVSGALSVENFTKLSQMTIMGSITSLNTKGCKALEGLWVWECDITELNLTENGKLKELFCFNNPLKKLNVSKNKKLRKLSVEQEYGELKKLNLTKNVNLEELTCNDNGLKKLNLSKNTKLRKLSIEGEELKKLNLTKNVNLEELNCKGNKIKKLNLSKNTKLKVLDCEWNYIKNLTIKSTLNKFDCSWNDFSKITIIMNNKTIILTVNGKGYIELPKENELLVKAVPKKGYKFVNWTTMNGEVFSKKKSIRLSNKKSYNLKANFKKKL